MPKTTTPQSIEFFRNDYRFLSNFHPCEIVFEGVSYPSAEHLYQALKTDNEQQREYVRSAATPQEAKRRGRSVTMVSKSEEFRINIMRITLVKKFAIERLQERLLFTKDATLIEGNYWHDNFFGVCHCGRREGCDGSGKNNLGKILMETRSYYAGLKKKKANRE